MIHSLNGKLIYTDLNCVVIECGGVGFSCFASANTITKLPQVNNNIMLYTYLNVKEDALDLYAFIDLEELKIFKTLITVSGVGPKIALSILSELSPDKLVSAIISANTKAISNASGVGAKMAQRICLELKDKVGKGSFEIVGQDVPISTAQSQNISDAIEALTSLGYTQNEASSAISKLDGTLPVEQLIKQGLIMLAKKL
ncbi:MAG: Holliday junction branch migration protein RuvA [Acutalibacteraceae bacterium]|nr:Holliday junction branch migration protein RuvA [Acutalibacteraceae bacterium]